MTKKLLTPTRRRFLTLLSEGVYVGNLPGLKIAPLIDAGLMVYRDSRWVITEEGRKTLAR